MTQHSSSCQYTHTHTHAVSVLFVTACDWTVYQVMMMTMVMMMVSVQEEEFRTDGRDGVRLHCLLQESRRRDQRGTPPCFMKYTKNIIEMNVSASVTSISL